MQWRHELNSCTSGSTCAPTELHVMCSCCTKEWSGPSSSWSIRSHHGFRYWSVPPIDHIEHNSATVCLLFADLKCGEWDSRDTRTSSWCKKRHQLTTSAEVTSALVRPVHLLESPFDCHAVGRTRGDSHSFSSAQHPNPIICLSIDSVCNNRVLNIQSVMINNICIIIHIIYKIIVY